MKLDEMEQGNKKKNGMFIGCDLSKGIAQLSHWSMDTQKPETFLIGKDEDFAIPICLCKRFEVNQWYFGNEAKRSADEGKGFLIENLLEAAVDQESCVVEGQEVPALELLLLFLRKCFELLSFIVAGHTVEGIMITVDKMQDTMKPVFHEMKQSLPVAEDKVFFQSHEESLYYYVMHQEEEIRRHQVAVLDFTGKMLQSYLLEINVRTKPVVSYITQEVHEEIVAMPKELSLEEASRHYKKLDQQFLTFLERYLDGKLVSGVYLIGEGFEGQWYQDSLKFLCRTRRVFTGNNLFGKGACYAAKEKVMPTEALQNQVFLNVDKCKSNIGIQVYDKGEVIYYPVLDAGMNWFEVKQEFECMFINGNEITLTITPLDGQGIYEEVVTLQGLPKRPERATRIHMEFTMYSNKELVVRTKDLGFGTFFIPTAETWEQTILL